MVLRLFRKSAARFDPWGFTTDLSADPYDLRPAATTIVDAVRLMHKENAGAVPIVMMGEIHNAPTHQYLSLLTLRALQDEGLKVAFAEEMNEDYASRGLEALYDLAPEAQPDTWRHDDGANALTLRVAYPGELSNLGRRHLNSFLWAQEIPVRYADLPYDDNKNLIHAHPFVAMTLADKGKPSDLAVHVESPLGMTIRNLYMARRIRAHIAQEKPDVCVLATGSTHMFGHAREDLPYETSLGALLDDDAVLPVFIGNAACREFFSHAAYGVMANGVYVRQAAYPVFNGMSAPDDQQALFDVFNRHSGGRLSMPGLSDRSHDARQDMRSLFGDVPLRDTATFERGMLQRGFDRLRAIVAPDPMPAIQKWHNRADAKRCAALLARQNRP